VTEKQIFRLITRGVGLVSIALGLTGFIGALLAVVGLESGPQRGPVTLLVSGLAYSCSGIGLLLASGLVANLFYRRSETVSSFD